MLHDAGKSYINRERSLILSINPETDFNAKRYINDDITFNIVLKMWK